MSSFGPTTETKELELRRAGRMTRSLAGSSTARHSRTRVCYPHGAVSDPPELCRQKLRIKRPGKSHEVRGAVAQPAPRGTFGTTAAARVAVEPWVSPGFGSSAPPFTGEMGQKEMAGKSGGCIFTACICACIYTHETGEVGR